jgi:adenosylcobinamide-phosphate synthase
VDWINLTFLTDRIIVLIAALAISAICFGTAGLRRITGIQALAIWIDGAIRRAESKLNRERRSAGTRVYRGIILLLLFLGLVLLPAIGLYILRLYWPYALYIEMVLLAAIIPVRALLDETRNVSRLLKANRLSQAQSQVAALARRDHGELDRPTIIRVTIEYLMENLSDKIVCPALWYLLLGFPGALAARMINALDGVVGHKSRRFIAFGWASARLDDLIQLIPARLTGLLLCLAACFIPRGKPISALFVLWRDSGKTTSPNSGWSIAAAAGALKLTLAGPRRVAEGVVRDAWIGQGTLKPGRRDLSRAQWLYAVTVLLLILMLGVVLATMPDG